MQKPLLYEKFRLRVPPFPRWKRRHFQSVFGIPPDVGYNPPALLFHHPFQQGEIFPAAGLVADLFGEGEMGKIVLRHNEQSRSILVDPMHNPRPQHAVDPRKIMAVPKQTVDQRMIRIAWSRMDD